MKKKTLTSIAIAAVLTGCAQNTPAASEETGSDTLNGTYAIHVEGYDYGAGVSKAILKLDQKVENVDAADIKVMETKQNVDWTDESYPVIEQTAERTVTDAYTCDAAGSKISEASDYIAFDLRCDPNEGSPFLFSPADFTNKWSDPYYLSFELNEESDITASGTVITTLNIEQNYTEMTTEADAYVRNDFNGSDGVHVGYGLYKPAEECSTLFVWLHGGGEGFGNTENSDPRVAALGNEVTAFLSDEFQNTIGGAAVLVPQSDTVWLDTNGHTGNLDAWVDGDTPEGKSSYYLTAVKELIDSVKEEVHAEKVVLAGCSAGGYMTLDLLNAYPDAFTAAVPICERYPVHRFTDEKINELAKMPLFFIYTENDPSNDPNEFSKPLIERLRKANPENLHVSSFEDAVDLTGAYDYINGEPYVYNGHWAWVYFDNNAAKCDECGIAVWDWIAEAIK